MARVVMCCVLIGLAPVFAGDNQWESRIEGSYVNVSGNSDSETVSGKLDVAEKEGPGRFGAKVHYLASRTDGESSADKLLFQSKYERTFTGSFFGCLDLDYTRDRFAGFDHRIAVGPGVGFDVIHSENHLLKGTVSALYYYESYSAGERSSDDFLSAKTGLTYEWTIRENVTFKLSSDLSFSFEDTEKYYFHQEAHLEAAMTSTLSLGISYTLDYQNLPPSESIKTTDTAFLTSLIINLKTPEED